MRGLAAALALLALCAIGLSCSDSTGVHAMHARAARSHSDAALQPADAAAKAQAALEARARQPRPPFQWPGEAPPTELSTMLGSSLSALAQLEVPSLRLDIYTKMRLLGETVAATQPLVSAEHTPWHWHLDLLRGQCLEAAEEQERIYQKAKRELIADAQRRSARAAHDPEAKGLADLSWAMVKSHTDDFLSGKPMVKYLRTAWQNMAHLQRVQVLQSETVHPGQSTNGQQFASLPITYVLDARGRVTHLSGYVSPLPNRYNRGGVFGSGLGGGASSASSPVGANRPAAGRGASSLGGASNAGAGVGDASSFGGGGGNWNYPANGLVSRPAALSVSAANVWATVYAQALHVAAGEEYRQWNSSAAWNATAGQWGQGYFFPLEFGGSKEDPLNLFPQREYTRRAGAWQRGIEWTQQLRGYISADHESPSLGCLRIDQSLRYNRSDDRAVVPLGGWYNVSVHEACLFRKYDWKGTQAEKLSAGGFRTLAFNWTQDERPTAGPGFEPLAAVVLPKLVEPFVAPASGFGNSYAGIPQIAHSTANAAPRPKHLIKPRFATKKKLKKRKLGRK